MFTDKVVARNLRKLLQKIPAFFILKVLVQLDHIPVISVRPCICKRLRHTLRKVLSGHMLTVKNIYIYIYILYIYIYIDTFCIIQSFCKQTVKSLIRLTRTFDLFVWQQALRHIMTSGYDDRKLCHFLCVPLHCSVMSQTL